MRIVGGDNGTKSERASDQYAYTSDLTDSDWAWEFLRRNPAYRRDYIKSRARLTKPVMHVSGLPIWRPRGCQALAQHWGLCCFANPDRNALEQPIFWSQRSLKNQVRATAMPVGDDPNSTDLDLCCNRLHVAILEEPACQKLIVRRHGFALDLTITGKNILFSPVHLEFRIEGLASICEGTKALSLLDSLLASKRIPSSVRSRKRDQNRLRQTLVALDCNLKGGSLRDTAMMLRAQRLTRLEWSANGDETLKKQVWRSRNAGLQMMETGYRKLF